MTGRASVVFEVCELLPRLCRMAVLGQGRDATDRCEQSDAPFGLLFKLLTLRRISKQFETRVRSVSSIPIEGSAAIFLCPGR